MQNNKSSFFFCFLTLLHGTSLSSAFFHHTEASVLFIVYTKHLAVSTFKMEWLVENLYNDYHQVRCPTNFLAERKPNLKEHNIF